MSRLSFSAWVGFSMCAVYVILGIVGPWIAPFAPDGQQFEMFLPPSTTHWLGTDSVGNDNLSQLLWGTRVSIYISVPVVLISSVIGVLLGTLSGYFRGWVDEVFMRFVDMMMAFPGILLNIAVVALVPRPGVGTLVVALVVNGWVGYARVARGQTLMLREQEFVQAARAIGVSPLWVMARHVIPNLLAPIIVQMTFALGAVILVETSLSFLGLGPQLSYTWGALLQQGYEFLFKDAFAYFIFLPGIAIMWVVLGANLAGDGLRDALDPTTTR